MNPQNQPEQPSAPNAQPQYQPSVEPQVPPQPVSEPVAPSQPGMPAILGGPAVAETVQPVAVTQPDPISFTAQQPGVQPQTQATTQPYAAGPGGNPSGKKKLFVILGSVIGGLIVVGGIAAAVYFMFFFVSKDDYKAAASTSGTVNTKLSSISKPVIDLNGGPSSFDNLEDAFGSVEKTYGEYKTEVAKLADSRAVKNDADVKRLHDLYKKKHDSYVTYMDKLIGSKPALLAIETCVGVESSNESTIEAVRAALKPCQDGLGAVKSEQTNAHVMKVVEGYKSFLASTLEMTELMMELKSQSTSASAYAEYTQAMTKYYEGSEAFTKALEDAQDGLKKDADDANPTSSLKSVTDKLNEKAK